MAGSGAAKMTMLVRDELGAVHCQHFDAAFPSLSASMHSQNVSTRAVLQNMASILSANRSAHSNGDTIAVFGVIKELQQSALISRNETRSMMHGVIGAAADTADIESKGVAALQSTQLHHVDLLLGEQALGERRW